MTMTTATQRPDRVQPDSPIGAGYRTFAGVRTRVLQVSPPAPAKRRARVVKSTRFVMFHGYCDSADTWRRVLAEIAESGGAAVAVDLPGFGDADPLRAGPILPQLDAFVRAVVLDQAKHGDVVLVGNSLGGTVSLRAAQNARLPIAGVVSIAAPGLSDSWLVNTIKRFPLPLRLYGAVPLPIPGAVIRGVANTVIPRLMYATPRDRDDEDVRRFIDLFPTHRSTRERLAQARQLTSEFHNLYELDRITAPLLVLTCGKDRLVRADSGRMLHTLVPHSRLVVHEDWGHCPQLDHAPEIHQLVTFFAESTRRAKQRVPRQRTIKRRAEDTAAG